MVLQSMPARHRRRRRKALEAADGEKVTEGLRLSKCCDMIPDDADVCFIRVLDYAVHAIRYTLDHVMKWNLALTLPGKVGGISESSFVGKLMLNSKNPWWLTCNHQAR